MNADFEASRVKKGELDGCHICTRSCDCSYGGRTTVTSHVEDKEEIFAGELKLNWKESEGENLRGEHFHRHYLDLGALGLHALLIKVIDAKKCSQQSTSTTFGVLLLEMLTGKAPVQSAAGQDEVVDLPRWIQSMVRQEWTADVFDVELIKYQDNIDKEMVQMPNTTYQATYSVLIKIG
ncbi:Concanavalin A-like lectin/glucanase, subgroup [Artemisia annua]|uniref:Concanavalin A-like lectin/glucanase, subgroup n=1 Tax=Artemisia annua TaxID=35608 RepID=A0A2U1KSK0_ARTAN|nr:Concanavalin A-like lectin/glucanase, subgroup [Artemisia annua]